MLVILASATDVEAQQLARQWQSDDAQLLTASDLSHPGWNWTAGATSGGRFTLGGRRCSVDAIVAVLTRSETIPPCELTRVHTDDRAYVAAEMHAFLVAWLAQLRCTVVNRPTPRCLLGPRWTPETWFALAARVALPVAGMERRVQRGGLPEVKSGQAVQNVVVVGQRALHCAETVLCDRARCLAEVASTRLLSVSFDADGRFVSANPRPPLDTPELVDAVHRELIAS